MPKHLASTIQSSRGRLGGANAGRGLRTSATDIGTDSLERRYRALQSKLEPPGQALLDRLFREFKHYGEAAWFGRHLKWLEDQFTPEAEEARQLKMRALRAAASRRARLERGRRGRERAAIDPRPVSTIRNAR